MASSDEELVTLSQEGDLDSFNQLVVRWERPIYALAYRVIGREEDARDVAQETFLRAFRALKGFKGDKTEQAAEVGKLLAQNAKKARIETAVFDRGGYLFHGRVKALADGAREGGLRF